MHSPCLCAAQAGSRPEASPHLTVPALPPRHPEQNRAAPFHCEAPRECLQAPSHSAEASLSQLPFIWREIFSSYRAVRNPVTVRRCPGRSAQGLPGRAGLRGSGLAMGREAGSAHGMCERVPGTLQTSPWAWGARPAVGCLTPEGRSHPAPASCTFALAATFLKTHVHPQEGGWGAGSTRAAGAHPHQAQQSPAALEPGLLPASCTPRPVVLLSASLVRPMELPGLSCLP